MLTHHLQSLQMEVVKINQYVTGTTIRELREKSGLTQRALLYLSFF